MPGCRCAVGRQLGLSQDNIRMCAGGEGGDNCGVWNPSWEGTEGDRRPRVQDKELQFSVVTYVASLNVRA